MIAEFKAHLSEYLAAVRNGETVEIYDRKTPVARIVPVTRERLRIHPAKRPPSPLPDDFKGIPPRFPVDVVALLREMRGDR